jgi:hypothetical protein
MMKIDFSVVVNASRQSDGTNVFSCQTVVSTAKGFSHKNLVDLFAKVFNEGKLVNRKLYNCFTRVSGDQELAAPETPCLICRPNRHPECPLKRNLGSHAAGSPEIQER